MVLTQGQIKHFVKRLEDEKAKKIAVINLTYPVTEVKYMALLKGGKGKMRSEKDVRARFIAKGKQSYAELHCNEVFDFSKEVDAIEKTNEVNRNKREDYYLLINEQIEKLTDEAYIGDAGALLGMLENFRRMTFGVKA